MFSCVKVCGVSILRAGEVLEPGLLSVCKDATLGKILIQTNLITEEPEVCESVGIQLTLEYTILFAIGSFR